MEHARYFFFVYVCVYQYLAAQLLMCIYINFSKSLRLAMQMNSDKQLHSWRKKKSYS